jgi:hypothetical protein
MVARVTAGLARTLVYLSAGEAHSEHHGHRTSVSSVRSLRCPCEAGNAFLAGSGAAGIGRRAVGTECERGRTEDYQGSKRKVTLRCDTKWLSGNKGLAVMISEITQGNAVETCVTKTARFEPKSRTTTQNRVVGQAGRVVERLEDVCFGAASRLGSLRVGRVDIAKG